MRRFVVRFLKDVAGPNGHDVEICQYWLEVDAVTEGEAAEIAKRKFCEAEGVVDWLLHADRVQVAEAEYPS